MEPGYNSHNAETARDLVRKEGMDTGRRYWYVGEGEP